VSYDPDAERYPDDETREDVGQQAGALAGKHPGEIVGHGRKRRLGEPHESEPGSEVLFRKALVAQHHGQGRPGDRRDGVQHAEAASEQQADAALIPDGPAKPGCLQQDQRQQDDEGRELEPPWLHSVH